MPVDEYFVEKQLLYIVRTGWNFSISCTNLKLLVLNLAVHILG